MLHVTLIFGGLLLQLGLIHPSLGYVTLIFGGLFVLLGIIYLFLLTTGCPTLFARVCYTDFWMLTSSFVINPSLGYVTLIFGGLLLGYVTLIFVGLIVLLGFVYLFLLTTGSPTPFARVCYTDFWTPFARVCYNDFWRVICYFGIVYLFLLTTGCPTLFVRVCYTYFWMLTSSFVINPSLGYVTLIFGGLLLGYVTLIYVGLLVLLGFVYLFLLTTGSPTPFARVCYTDFWMLTSSFLIIVLVFTNTWVCYTDFLRLTSTTGPHTPFARVCYTDFWRLLCSFGIHILVSFNNCIPTLFARVCDTDFWMLTYCFFEQLDLLHSSPGYVTLIFGCLLLLL